MLTWWESNWSMSEPCSGEACWRFNAMAVSPGWPHLDSQLPANQCPPHTGLPEDVWGRDLLLPWDAEARWLARARPRERRRWGARTLGQTVTITTEGLRLTEGWQCTLYWDLHHHHHTINNRQQAPHCHTVPTRHCKHKCGVKDQRNVLRIWWSSDGSNEGIILSNF